MMASKKSDRLVTLGNVSRTASSHSAKEGCGNYGSPALSTTRGFSRPTDILLCTFNAKYAHTSFGLRYLRANLKEFRDFSTLREFTIKNDPRTVALELLRDKPLVVGLGVYIWNVEESKTLLKTLRKVAPEIILIAGGPEVSHLAPKSDWDELVDFIVQGEGEEKLHALLESLNRGQRPAQKRHPGSTPSFDALELPYDEYSDTDLKQRVLYVEASRGCPFKCSF